MAACSLLRLLYSTRLQVELSSCITVTLDSKRMAASTGDENILYPGDEPLLFLLLLVFPETGSCLKSWQINTLMKKKQYYSEVPMSFQLAWALKVIYKLLFLQL